MITKEEARRVLLKTSDESEDTEVDETQETSAQEDTSPKEEAEQPGYSF
jgi:hypothetical protein